MPVPTNPRPSLGKLLLQIAGDGVLAGFLQGVDVPACRLELGKHLLPGEDPAPYLRALEAVEALQGARRDLRDALEEILGSMKARRAAQRP